MKSFEMDFDAITLDLGEMYRFMGLSPENGAPDGEIGEFFDRTLEQIEKVCRPRFGYRILPAGEIAGRSIVIGGETFKTGAVITPFFREATHFALFVATAGAEFDAWLHGQKESGDIMAEYVGDAFGSEIAEGAARETALRLEAEAASLGMQCSNAYSPGYCGWRIDEQQRFFSLLPPAPCGITLNASCLMTPIKSVSGLIALGPHMEKKPYGCAICDRKDCYKKR